MVVKMRKWSPWPPSSAAATRKFQVAVKQMKLDGLTFQDDDDSQKFVAIKIKWKGEPKLFPLITPFKSRPKKQVSTQKMLTQGGAIIQWGDDELFENTCCFSVVSNHHHHDHPKFGAWEIAFNVLYGGKSDSKAKMGVVIGRVSVNISEIASKMDKSLVEEKLPLSLQIDGFAREASLTVLFNFVEIRESPESKTITRTKSAQVKDLSLNETKENGKARRRSLSLSLDESDESTTFEPKDAAAQTSHQTNSLDSGKKEGWFSWKSPRFSFKRAKTKDEKTDDEINADAQCTASASALQKENEYEEDNREGAWEEKEIISRDGLVKLKALVFFASFDQRSDKAAGESACTALVAVISHWLHSNRHAMPNRLEFDNLIMQGSSEWRKLCEDASYVNDFPNKHFDLETVLRADIRPISISHTESFVGFFDPEKFESLKGAMCFDDIWDHISSNTDSVPRIYIVSWNDHFFVLKAEADAYYIIDTLGERLFEGCNQAYVLRFDETTQMQKQTVDEEKAGKPKTEEQNRENTEEEKEKEEEEEEEEIICSGKECCREFIKRFLAAIPLKELEEEERKKPVSYYSLHNRLQIEFNYSCTSSPPSSSTSSPFSSITTPQSSPFSE